ncbi:MAG TPA: mechanosensitive ion channel domain-containing protein, partial [Stellaceae bacterium]|nr:mechanosensitive ion channel domain-containing protein [Stellaceae bacterium]
VTVTALFEAWGVNSFGWFAYGHIGARLVSALLTTAIAAVAAVIVWEAIDAAVVRHLARLEAADDRSARLRTLLPMLRTTLFGLIVTVLALTVLSEIGINVAPLLAGAGIVGIAVGFGSQKLVQDVITGLFLLVENAIHVGDAVNLSGLSGTIEKLTIRTIWLRAGDGSVNVVPFSSVTTITNMSRGTGNAAVSVTVAYNEDLERVTATLGEIAAELRQDPAIDGMIRGDIQLLGVDKVSAAGVTVIGQIPCTPNGRWPVQREFNRRLKERFQALGIEMANPA